MTYYNCSSIHVIFIFVRGVLFIFANFSLGWIHVEEVKSFGILRCPFFGVTSAVLGGGYL
jgi:hypothetical protein